MSLKIRFTGNEDKTWNKYPRIEINGNKRLTNIIRINRYNFIILKNDHIWSSFDNKYIYRYQLFLYNIFNFECSLLGSYYDTVNLLSDSMLYHSKNNCVYIKYIKRPYVLKLDITTFNIKMLGIQTNGDKSLSNSFESWCDMHDDYIYCDTSDKYHLLMEKNDELIVLKTVNKPYYFKSKSLYDCLFINQCKSNIILDNYAALYEYNKIHNKWTQHCCNNPNNIELPIDFDTTNVRYNNNEYILIYNGKSPINSNYNQNIYVYDITNNILYKSETKLPFHNSKRHTRGINKCIKFTLFVSKDDTNELTSLIDGFLRNIHNKYCVKYARNCIMNMFGKECVYLINYDNANIFVKPLCDILSK